jgi:hypothetical protein
MSSKKSSPRGNVPTEAAYDPFPKSGLVKQYEPFIRARVAKFCEQFPWLRYDDVLIEAVRLADGAAKRFNPDLGHDFSTLLGHYLKKLYAMQEEEKGWTHAAPTDWAEDQECSPRPVFPTGANGTRVVFDRWNLHGDDKRRGVVIAMRLNGNSESYAVGFFERASVAVAALGNDTKLGWLKAAVDHLERRQREEEAETEDRRYGIYMPTFLEVRPVALHREHYQARTPRHSSLFPDKYDGREEWDENWQSQLGTILHVKSHGHPHSLRPRGLSGEEIDVAESRFHLASAALRPFLSVHERVVLDWMGDQMFPGAFVKGRLGHKLRIPAEQIADEIGRSKRTVYKIRDRLIVKLKKELKNNFQK